jgi:hypothetical protein
MQRIGEVAKKKGLDFSKKDDIVKFFSDNNNYREAAKYSDDVRGELYDYLFSVWNRPPGDVDDAMKERAIDFIQDALGSK